MALAQNWSGKSSSAALRPVERATLALIGIGVIFASLGLGEAVYRLIFFDFAGATDRLPIELMFGIVLAAIAAKLVKRFCQYRTDTSARIRLIRDRNRKIRRAAEAILPLSSPGHQQAVRVIREQVDHIEWVLADITPH